jgi:hypothetical protein
MIAEMAAKRQAGRRSALTIGSSSSEVVGDAATYGRGHTITAQGRRPARPLAGSRLWRGPNDARHECLIKGSGHPATRRPAQSNPQAQGSVTIRPRWVTEITPEFSAQRAATESWSKSPQVSATGRCFGVPPTITVSSSGSGG